MRVCVLIGGIEQNNSNLKSLASQLARGIETQGHLVETFDMYQEKGKNISFYDYIVIISESVSFFGGKIPNIVPEFLKTAGTISGKRCSCYISKKGMRKLKTLSRLMSLMEQEGMYLKVSDILNKTDYAFATGKRLHIER